MYKLLDYLQMEGILEIVDNTHKAKGDMTVKDSGRLKEITRQELFQDATNIKLAYSPCDLFLTSLMNYEPNHRKKILLN